jgi:hypothetical protein
MAIVRRRLHLVGGNKRMLVLPTRKNLPHNNNKKRKLDAMVTFNKDDDDGNVVNSDDPSSSSSPPPRTLADFRSETVVTPPPPLGKGVRFADEDQEHCSPYSYAYLKSHKSELWYPKKYRQEQQQHVQEIIATFKEEHPDTVADFAALYKSIADHHQQQELATCKIQLPLEMRGLEWGITPQLRTRRKRHIRQVLDCADVSLPQSFQQVMRHSTSVRSSRAAVAMAQWYAQEEDEAEEDQEENAPAQVEDESSNATTSKQQQLPSNRCASLQETVEPMTGLPPRQPLQPKRMCLWQR